MLTISEFLLTFVLNAVWQVALITLVASVSVRLLGGVPARYKYILWAAALSLSLLLPVFTSLGRSPVKFFDALSSTVAANSAADRLRTTTLPPNQAMTAVGGVTAPTVTLALGAGSAIVLCTVYLLFVLYRAARLFKAWRRTRAIGRDAFDGPLPEHVRTAIAECKAAIGVRDVTVLYSKDVSVPVMIGAVNAVIILPEQMLGETDRDVLITALGHELVHVRRRDYFSNLMFELIYLPISFHPAARYAKRRIDQMREICCDDVVATRLLKAEDYARSLVSIAGLAVRPNPLARILTVGITDAESLEVRIMSLLKRSEINVYKKSFLAVAAILLMAVPFTAAAVFVTSVGVNEAGPEASAKPAPTPPADESTTRDLEKLQVELKAISNIQDPQERKARQEKLEKKMIELRLEPARGSLSEQKEELEKVQMELVELSAKGGELEAENKARLEKLQIELKQLNGEADEATVVERKLVEERAIGKRLLAAKLSADAKIKMEQAIEIALGYQSGTVVEKVVGMTPKGEIVFSILIRDAAGDITTVTIDGSNGNIINAEKQH